MPFDNDIVDQVRSSNDIVDVVSSYVPLKKIGARYRGLCPFHNEKTPSFYVNGSMKIFKCFGCGESGDVFSFIEKIENVGFYEAFEILAKRAGITLPERKYDSERAARRSLKESIAVINKEAATYYYMMLRGPKGTKAYEYLKNRGLSDDTMRNFGLGFAGNYSNGLYNYLKEKEYLQCTKRY